MKSITFREMQFRLGETPLCDPKAPQDEAKIGPRSPQDGLKTDQKAIVFEVDFIIDFWSSWGSFGVILGRLGGSWGALGRSWRLLERSWGELTPQGGQARFDGGS